MTPEQRNLLEHAARAAERAYAPYSRFRVGAAVLAGGQVFLGANVENASSNLGICAERVALAQAVVQGGCAPGSPGAPTVEGVAVCCLDAASDDDGRIPLSLAMPCGGCRQWLAELAPEAWVVTSAQDVGDDAFTVPDLLPEPFRLVDKS